MKWNLTVTEQSSFQFISVSSANFLTLDFNIQASIVGNKKHT